MVFVYNKDSNGIYHCNDCDFTTHNQSTMHYHIKVKHTGELEYECADCDMKFSQKSQLNLHIKSRHSKKPVKEYKLPVLERSDFEDAFDEIEILSFPVSCSPFDLMKTKYRGDVMAKDLLKFHRKEIKMLAYLVSTKQVPTKAGTMYFGTWIDAEGEYFDTAHFANSLVNYPFKGGGCYLLFGKVEVDFHFPTITISKMSKMPFIADPRYSNSSSRQFKVHEQIKQDVSSTHRAPYPTEIGLPRHKMKNS